jgi:hypothetical protein
LDSLVFSVYLDTEKYNVLLCSSCNAIIVSATDLTCTWSFKDSLTTTIYTCDQLFGGGFIPVDRAILEREKERKMAKSEHSSKLAVGFAYQGGDMRFHKQIQIIDVYGMFMTHFIIIIIIIIIIILIIILIIIVLLYLNFVFAQEIKRLKLYISLVVLVSTLSTSIHAPKDPCCSPRRMVTSYTICDRI